MLKLILPQQAIHRQVFNNANPFLYLSLFALVKSRLISTYEEEIFLLSNRCEGNNNNLSIYRENPPNLLHIDEN